MSFSTNTLSSQLQGIRAETFPDTAAEWADAIAAYFTGSVTSNGVSFTLSGAAIALAVDAFIDATDDGDLFRTDGPAAVEAGLVAWWAQLSAAPSSYFAGATAITPPTAGLTTIAADMPAQVFDLNQAETTLAPAMDRLAAFLHARNAGGTATIATVARTIT